MNKYFKFHLLVPLLFLMSLYQSAAQGFEEKPKYAPGKEKHRNKTDEIGRRQGKWLYYNTFSEKVAEIDYVNDKKEGVERKFYGYDKVKEETEYLGGVKEGQYTKYFFSGQVMLEGTYQDGKKSGKWTKYFEDGTIRQDGSYKNNLRDGVWKTYNRKGAVISQLTYKDGQDVAVLEEQKKKADEAKKAAEKKAAGSKSPQPVPAGGKAPAAPAEPKKK